MIWNSHPVWSVLITYFGLNKLVIADNWILKRAADSSIFSRLCTSFRLINREVFRCLMPCLCLKRSIHDRDAVKLFIPISLAIWTAHRRRSWYVTGLRLSRARLNFAINTLSSSIALWFRDPSFFTNSTHWFNCWIEVTLDIPFILCNVANLNFLPESNVSWNAATAVLL